MQWRAQQGAPARESFGYGGSASQMDNPDPRKAGGYSMLHPSAYALPDVPGMPLAPPPLTAADFEAMDKDGDGVISKAEFMAFLSGYSQPGLRRSVSEQCPSPSFLRRATSIGTISTVAEDGGPMERGLSSPTRQRHSIGSPTTGKRPSTTTSQDGVARTLIGASPSTSPVHDADRAFAAAVSATASGISPSNARSFGGTVSPLSRSTGGKEWQTASAPHLGSTSINAQADLPPLRAKTAAAPSTEVYTGQGLRNSGSPSLGSLSREEVPRRTPSPGTGLPGERERRPRTTSRMLARSGAEQELPPLCGDPGSMASTTASGSWSSSSRGAGAGGHRVVQTINGPGSLRGTMFASGAMGMPSRGSPTLGRGRDGSPEAAARFVWRGTPNNRGQPTGTPDFMIGSMKGAYLPGEKAVGGWGVTSNRMGVGMPGLNASSSSGSLP